MRSFRDCASTDIDDHMNRFLALFSLLALIVTTPAMAAPVRVTLETTAGNIVIELAMKQAPITSANFLAYVDRKRFDGTEFYRVARTPGAKGRGFIQGGIRHSFAKMLNPIAHEPTSKTGLRHLDGTISMARDEPGTAMGDFFIACGPLPSMDATPKNPGFAAFGKVVKGMDVVHRILAMRTIPRAGREGMKDQMLDKPVRILSAHRS